ncbi:MAG: ribosome small subunit-dependent GTPase A, partial [Phycisphaeraceae bacterium]|nr:ribosome small subunit-dependent GTPase A [Phycisphaeraceae bacterium]
TALGFDNWFEDNAANLLRPGYSIARITAVDRGGFFVRTECGETYAEIAGKFRFQIQSTIDLPCVGDWVCIQCSSSGGPAIIHEVLPRKTFLRRKRPGKLMDFQMIAANIDVAFIVQGCQYDFNMPRLDRYLVMANGGHIEPQIILSKTDLISKEELTQRIEAIRNSGISASILSLSNTTGFGLNELRDQLDPGKTYCLLGSSGVGKTTLINRLIGQEAFETKPVSGTGEGTHTTSRRQLVILSQGAMLIDTPGMRELGIIGTSDGINTGFEEFVGFSDHCRYADCSHAHEPGCAVRAAVENGELSADRYSSYIKLKKESTHYETSYLDKRKRDKAFGRFVKSAKKQMKNKHPTN